MITYNSSRDKMSEKMAFTEQKKKSRTHTVMVRDIVTKCLPIRGLTSSITIQPGYWVCVGNVVV